MSRVIVTHSATLLYFHKLGAGYSQESIPGGRGMNPGQGYQKLIPVLLTYGFHRGLITTVYKHVNEGS